MLTLQSARLALRDFHEDDLPAYQALRATPAFGRHYSAEELTPAFSARLLQRFIEQQRAPRSSWQLAITRREDGWLLGSAGLRGGWQAGVASFGIELAEDAWGQGYALEAGRLLLDAGFNRLGISRVEADTAEANHAARALAARLGFVETPPRAGRVALALSLGMPGVESDWRLQGEGSALNRLDGGWRLGTAAEPGFYFGNALLLDGPPQPGSRAAWERRFSAAFDDPAVRHVNLQWAQAEGDENYADWQAAGYHYFQNIVLLTHAELLRPVAASPALAIRPLSSEADWRQWRQLMVDTRDDGHEEADYRAYLQGREQRYRELEAAGDGHVWGVFDGEELLSSAGLFLQPGLGRFQLVTTAPHARRLGLASQLVSHLAQWGLERRPRLLIVADAHYHALALYRQLGFVDAGREAALCRWT